MGEDQAPAPAPAAASTGPELYKVKVDHFVGVNVLGEEAALAGAPNFRQVNPSSFFERNMLSSLRIRGSFYFTFH